MENPYIVCYSSPCQDKFIFYLPILVSIDNPYIVCYSSYCQDKFIFHLPILVSIENPYIVCYSSYCQDKFFGHGMEQNTLERSKTLLNIDLR